MDSSQSTEVANPHSLDDLDLGDDQDPTGEEVPQIKQEVEENEDSPRADGDEEAAAEEDDDNLHDAHAAGMLFKPVIENILSSSSTPSEEEEEDDDDESEESVSEFEEEDNPSSSSFHHHHNGGSSLSTSHYGSTTLHPFASPTPVHIPMTMTRSCPSSHPVPKFIDSSGLGERKKREAFTLQQKLEVLKFLETHSVNATSRFYKVDPKSIRLWRSQKNKIEVTVQEELMALQQQGETDGITPRKRISGAGRKKRNNKVIVEIEENPNKRHRRTIKLSDKVEIIRLIENGQTQSDVARSLGISQSTVQTIWSNKGDILERNLCPKKKRKNLHWKKYSIIDTALFNWVRQCRESAVTLDTKMLQDKAVEYAEYYKQQEFKAQATRWIDVFKRRHSLMSELDRQDRLQLAAAASLSIEQHTLGQLTAINNHTHHHHHQQLSHLNSQSANNNNHHDLVPDFDLSSLPGLMAGLYPPDSTPPNSSSSNPLQQQHVPTQPILSFNSHLPAMPVVGGPVTTCDAMKYVELIRAWISSTFGDNEEILNNHLNAIENAVLKRRMTEMMAPTNNQASHR